ncbi:TPA: triose-phosphate isomerase [Candidatus Berkelbacteria bacterium]|uniref:Triosephosphate isomerase n=1 Tax=Berkelbacteria bacterium GW2011_GWE1_39_12 TaxID=1618337 RepID=A0A0G4B207_9BACT|nr:MAG: triosephosphate isomerase, triosephosphate isomerase (TIM) [Berkelbacteria bacterium GW2011_GWE1_39_12]HBO60620.1 triose-phosphate isomerase [Candidatus Berkelbacteria bacterium]
MRRPIIVGNWKMNTNLADAIVLATSVKNAVADLGVEIILCPPFIWLYPLAEILEKSPSNLKLGAQNMWFAEKGAMTGEVSPNMVKVLAKYVILGHSERRSNFLEDNNLICDKVTAALENGLTPIVCVGEKHKRSLAKKPGRPNKLVTENDLFSQLKGSLKNISRNDADKIIIAYEPVWAIGTGDAATGGYAAEVIKDLRDILADLFGGPVSERIHILYGGSVDSENVREFVFQPEIDGVLVGGASLKAKEFIKICREAAGGR